jgi:polyhydroxyalkanoate synthesis regulator phasin
MIGKVLKVILIIVGVLLVLLVALPFIFKDKIVERVKHEINEQVDARVEFGSFGLSLIRNFPNASFWVNDLRVIGEADFSGDTLANIGRTLLTVDLFGMIRGSDYEVKSIRLDRPRMLFKLLADGSANWNVVAVDEDAEVDIADQTSDFHLSLRRVDIREGYVAYLDDKNVTYIHANDINAVLRGDLTASITNLNTRDATIGSFSLRYDEWPVLSRVAARLTAEMEADLDRFVFTFRDNLIHLNALPLVFEGMVGWPEDDLEMDFRFAAARSDFASFLSLVPAMYTKDFESLTTSGSMMLEGHVKGAFTDVVYPGFGLNLQIDNGMFQYPGLPASVSHVNVSANIANPGIDLDLTVVDVPVFKMQLAGAPIEARFHLKTPMSDPQFDTWVAGQLDLSQVKQFYPLDEGFLLNGVVGGDVEMRGRLSDFEQGNYDAFHAAGNMIASDIHIDTPFLEHAVEVSSAKLRFDPKEVSLEAFTMKLGDSDISATGSLLNIPGYVFSDQLLRGRFTTHSSYFDLNALMEEAPEGVETAPAGQEVETADGSQLGVISIPSNIDFTLESSFDKVLFGSLQITDVHGVIHVADEQVNMENLRMGMLGGTLGLNGVYDSREQKPYVNLGLNMSGFDIQDAFQTFNTVQILAPIGEFARGTFSVDLQLSSLLTEGLQPVLSSLRGKGKLSSSAVLLQNTPSMVSLADQLHMDQLKEWSLKDLLLSFSFSDGKVEVPPIDLQFGDIGASITGVTYFDKRISYVMNLNIPREMFGGRANQVLDDLVSRASGVGVQLAPGDKVSLDVLLAGTFLKPEVSFSMASLRSSLEDQLRGEADRLLQEAENRLRDEAQQARDRVEDAVQEQVDDAQERIDAEVESRIRQIMDEANRQAATVRTQASNAAGKVREEAAEQAARLEQEAQSRGPIAQATARQAAQQLVREAERRAVQIESEGERNAQRIIDEAQNQADRLRSGQ